MKVLSLLLLTLSFPAVAVPLSPDHVTSLKAVTDDGCQIRVWSVRTRINRGQDMRFRFEVTNFGTKSFYLVMERKPKVTGNGVDIGVSADIPITGQYDDYDFTFQQLGAHKRFEGELVVKASEYRVSQLWQVHFGFAYVFDKSGLDRKLKPGEDWLILSAPLMERAQVVRLGSLDISVTE